MSPDGDRAVEWVALRAGAAFASGTAEYRPSLGVTERRDRQGTAGDRSHRSARIIQGRSDVARTTGGGGVAGQPRETSDTFRLDTGGSFILASPTSDSLRAGARPFL
jgi:hypothetical protein